MGSRNLKRGLVALLITAVFIACAFLGFNIIRKTFTVGGSVLSRARDAFLAANYHIFNKAEVSSEISSESVSDSAARGSEAEPGTESGISSNSGTPDNAQLPSGFVAYEYNKLSYVQKKVYDRFYTAVNNVEAEFSISEKVDQNDIDIISDALMEDHPELYFYYRGAFDLQYWEKGGGLMTARITPGYEIESKEVILRMKAEQESAVDSIVAAVIKPGYDEYSKEIALHNRLIEICEYDDAASDAADRGDYSSLSFTSYNALVKGKAVCAGYTAALKMLLNEVGIESYYASGTVYRDGREVAHAWNIVKISGDYYQVDATFDDMGKDTEYYSQITYEYFNVTDAFMSDRVYDEGEEYPACTATAQNYYVKNGLHIDSNTNAVDVIVTGMTKRLESGKLSSEFRFGPEAGGYTDKDFNNMLNLVDNRLSRTKIGGKRYYVDLYWYSKGDRVFALKFTN